MNEAFSRFYAVDGQKFEAQDTVHYYKYMEHADFCKKVINVCRDYLKTKNALDLYRKLKNLGLQNIVFNKQC